jgi:hypothetical protein
MNLILRRTAVASLTVLLLVIGGCDLTSLNEDPNNPTETEPPKLLANAQIDIANQYWQDYAGGFWVRYAQYWTTNQYTDADRYQYASSRPGSLNDLWEDYYLALNDLQEIIRINNREPEAQSAFGVNANQKAIALTMQAWTLKIMTDMWGPVPVAEALKGREQDNFSPTYNEQEVVYDTLLARLTRANNLIDPSSDALASGDVVYGGDMSKWKKFTNSLKMRVAITIADRSPGKASTAIEEAISAGVFESNADNALVPFNTDPPYQNPFYENYEVEGRDDWAAPSTVVEPMNNLQDPRRPAYFTDADTAAGNQFVGFPYGLEQGDAQSLFTSGNFSRPSERVRGEPAAPCILMLYDEVQFIKAEAALRSDLNVPSITKSGQQLFEEALEASARYWGVEDQTTINNWIGRVPSVNSGNYEQVLGTQKWLAQYLQGVPGWTTFRRLDFEGVLSPPDGDPGQEAFGRSFAVRMVYPNDEANLNEENLNDAINNKLGGEGASGDNQGVLLWWDTSPPPTP